MSREIIMIIAKIGVSSISTFCPKSILRHGASFSFRYTFIQPNKIAVRHHLYVQFNARIIILHGKSKFTP